MKAISLDLGGSHVTVAIVEDKTILMSQEISVDPGGELLPLLPRFKAIVYDMLAKLSIPVEECIGVAMGCAAMVDGTTGRVVSTNGKFEDSPAIDLPAWALRDFGLPFVLENDARMALLGEWYAGAAKGADDVVMVTLGTGIGGAAMAGGKVYRTKQVQGGCLGGHIPALFTGRKCTCGGFGCMEAEASGWALPLIAREWPGFEQSRLATLDRIDFRALFELAREGDSVAIGVRDRCLHVWACGTVGLIHAYGPELVVFGGGVMRSGDIILPYIRDYANRYSWIPSGPVRILPAALGNDAGILGAIPLLTDAASTASVTARSARQHAHTP
ncbi:MAG TPA: ROK family protein [Acidobacteriaceae bacterium]|nr:ROK family protein [Acidobacteriaceae bacterium]